jgi:hypothetical protein
MLLQAVQGAGCTSVGGEVQVCRMSARLGQHGGVKHRWMDLTWHLSNVAECWTGQAVYGVQSAQTSFCACLDRVLAGSCHSWLDTLGRSRRICFCA